MQARDGFCLTPSASHSAHSHRELTIPPALGCYPEEGVLTDWGAHVDRGPLGVIKLILQLLHSLEGIQLHTALLSKPVSHLRTEGREQTCCVVLSLVPLVSR